MHGGLASASFAQACSRKWRGARSLEWRPSISFCKTRRATAVHRGPNGCPACAWFCRPRGLEPRSEGGNGAVWCISQQRAWRSTAGASQAEADAARDRARAGGLATCNGWSRCAAGAQCHVAERPSTGTDASSRRHAWAADAHAARIPTACHAPGPAAGAAPPPPPSSAVSARATCTPGAGSATVPRCCWQRLHSRAPPARSSLHLT